MEEQNKSIALITGANKGIGLEIARQLGQKGYYILLGARDEQRGTAAMANLSDKGMEGELLLMDVGSDTSIQQAFDRAQSRVSHIDVLVNNAAILKDEGKTLLNVTWEVFQDTLRVNSFGSLQVVRTFLPLMKKGSRIIMLSSGAGVITGGVSSFAPVYAISKTLMNNITMHLARDLAPQGIVVNAVSPGWVRTDMGGGGAPRSVEKGAETPVWLATEAPSSLTGKFWKDKEEIAW